MLGGRKITAMLARETLKGYVARAVHRGTSITSAVKSGCGLTHRRTQ